MDALRKWQAKCESKTQIWNHKNHEDVVELPTDHNGVPPGT